MHVYDFNDINDWSQVGQTIEGDLGARMGQYVKISDAGNRLAVDEHSYSSGKGRGELSSLQPMSMDAVLCCAEG